MNALIDLGKCREYIIVNIGSIEDQFKYKIKGYLDTLDSTTKTIKRTELFSKVDFNFNKIEAWRW
jgi:hypothetical protein